MRLNFKFALLGIVLSGLAYSNIKTGSIVFIGKGPLVDGDISGTRAKVIDVDATGTIEVKGPNGATYYISNGHYTEVVSEGPGGVSKGDRVFVNGGKFVPKELRNESATVVNIDIDGRVELIGSSGSSYIVGKESYTQVLETFNGVKRGTQVFIRKLPHVPDVIKGTRAQVVDVDSEGRIEVRGANGARYFVEAEKYTKVVNVGPNGLTRGSKVVVTTYVVGQQKRTHETNYTVRNVDTEGNVEVREPSGATRIFTANDFVPVVSEYPGGICKQPLINIATR